MPERLWRQWRPNVTHNHVREVMVDLRADSDAWLLRMAANPADTLRIVGRPFIPKPLGKAA